MAFEDIGPAPQAFDIEQATLDNDVYRTVAWTGRFLQVTLMSIPVGGTVGFEVHPDNDQFLRIEGGTGKCIMGPAADTITFEQEVSDGWSIEVPAGTWHDVINIGTEPLKLYSIYAPVHHAAGIVQDTAEQAEKDEESGVDVPPAWAGTKPEGFTVGSLRR